MIGNQRHRGSPGRAALRGALAALLASLATTAAALDFPHGDSALLANSCQDCHVTHNATLPNLQGPNMDCLSCHAANGFPVGGTWTTANQAAAGGTTGSSHNWSLSATNATAGATPPTTGGMSAHLVGGALTCGVCHDPHTQAATPFDPTAPTLAGSAGRHFVRTNNANSDMCLDCHQTWAQSTEAERTYSATTNRSHPVGFKDVARTTPLTLAVAGSGNDRTYAKVPLDSAMKLTVVATGTTTSVLAFNGMRFATNALTGFVVRFTSGVYTNVQARVLSNAQSTLSVTTLPAIPAAGVTFEVDRAGADDAYDVTTNVGTTANQLGDPSKSWSTTGELSPTGLTVTILSTTAAMSSNVGRTCSITANTATALTLAAGCLTGTPAGGSWAYRINWRTAGRGTTSAAGGLNTFVDSSKTLFATDSLAGLQVRFPARNAVARITNWNTTTFTATFTPALGTAVAAGEDYVLEPAQIAAATGRAQSGTTASVTVAGTPFNGLSLAGALVRFTKAGNVANQGTVSRVSGFTTSGTTSTTVNFTALPAAVLANDTFEIDLDGNVTNNVGLGGAAGSATSGNVVCQSCHGVHMADSDASTYDDVPRTGDGNLLRRSPGDTCGGCHQTAIHSSVSTDSKYGTWGTGFTCATCHQPHQTPNIYLVKQQIATPNSGTKFVTFQNTTGGAANSFATATNVVPAAGTSAGTAVEVCNACHTQTTRARNNAATDWSTHFNGGRCSTCHTHDGGFAGAESKGAIVCTNCHDYGMRTADATRQGSYHHVMEAGAVINASSQTAYPTNATPVTDATVDKTCVQCHVDHNLFRPDLNTGIAANGRGNNLRTRIGSSPPLAVNSQVVNFAPNDTTSFFGNYDYANAGVGGICISCHQASQTRDVTNQQNAGDGSTLTVTVPLADFAAGAHAYTVGGTITNGTAPTVVACTKCHNSDPNNTGYQSGANGARFALHTSPDRRLRAPLGQAAQQDDHSEDFCYRCHSTFANGTLVGGVFKPAANNDWYGAVTTMSAASQDIYTQMQKGVSGTPAGGATTATNTLYFKPTAEETPAAPLPTTHYGNDTLQAAPAAMVTRAMSPYPSAAANEQIDTVAVSVPVSTTTYWRRVAFVSPPVAAAVTTTAAAWTLNVYDYESATGANAHVRYAVYKWDGVCNPTGATPTCTAIVARATYGTGSTNRMPTTAGGALQTIATAAGSAVALAVGDRIVVDLEINTQATTTTTATMSYFFGATAAANVVIPNNVTFTYTSRGSPASGRHDVANYTGKHKPNPVEETRASIAANKHVECEDCHDPHATKPGRHTKGVAGLAGVLTGASGVGVTTWGANWAGVTSFNPGTTTAALITATAEWQVCFKCHSSANASVTSFGGTGAASFTDLALEFNPSNNAYHPVIQAIPAGAQRLAATALTGGWTPGQVMTCSDCHGSDSTASTGPHGSAVKWMLNPNTTGTKYYNWPYTTSAGNGASTGTLLAGTGSSTTLPTNNFCFSCHVWAGGGDAHIAQGGTHGVACVSCHIRVPHGAKTIRLLTGPNAPARYKPDGNGGGTISMNGGTRAAAGATMGTTNCNTTGGCGAHSASTAVVW